MSNSNTPAPIRIEYPPGTHKRDAPTGGGDPAHVLSNNAQLALSNVLNGQLPVNPALDLVPFQGGDGLYCYRNSVLTLLLNLKPFLNFVHQVAAGEGGSSNSLLMLKHIAEVYWDDQRTTDQRKQDLVVAVDNWFFTISTFPSINVPNWNQADQQADTIEFVSHYLNWSLDNDLQRGNNHGLTDSAQVLRRLLKIRTISRRAYECQCNEKERRTFNSQNDTDLWCVSVNANSQLTPLQTLLSNYLYDSNDSFAGNCPTCGAQQIRYHRYEKFKYLPEVLLVGITHVHASGREDHRADTAVPDQINLSYLQDYQPDDGAESTSRTADYKLQVLIAYKGSRVGGHYYTCVSRQDNTWTVVDELDSDEVTNGHSHFVLKRGYKARMVAYVRVPPKNVDQPAINTIDPALTAQLAVSATKSTTTVLGNGGDDDNDRLASDTTGMSDSDVSNFLETQNINTNRATKPATLRQYADKYLAANRLDRLRMLRKTELIRQATAAGIAFSSKSKAEDLAVALDSHAAQQVAQATTPIAQTASTDTRLHARSTDQMDNTGPQGQIDNLQHQVQNLLQSLHRTQRERDRLQRDVLIYMNALQSQAASPERTPPQPSNQTITQPATQTSAAPGNQSIIQPNTAGAAPTSTQSLLPIDTSLPILQTTVGHVLRSAQPGTYRILRVTTKGVIDSLRADQPWSDDIKYVLVPNYGPNRHLITSQWWRIHETPRPGATDPNDREHRVIVYVVVQSQSQGQPDYYQFEVFLGVGENIIPTPRLDVELLQLNQLSADTKVLCTQFNQPSELSGTPPTDAQGTVDNTGWIQQSQAVVPSSTASTDARTPLSDAGSTDQYQPARALWSGGRYGYIPPTDGTGVSDMSLIPKPALVISLEVQPQVNGHSARHAYYFAQLANYNTAEVTRSTIEMAVFTAEGLRPLLDEHYTRISRSEQTEMAADVGFQAIQSGSFTPSIIAASSFNIDNPAFNAIVESTARANYSNGGAVQSSALWSSSSAGVNDSDVENQQIDTRAPFQIYTDPSVQARSSFTDEAHPPTNWVDPSIPSDEHNSQSSAGTKRSTPDGGHDEDEEPARQKSRSHDSNEYDGPPRDRSLNPTRPDPMTPEPTTHNSTNSSC